MTNETYNSIVSGIHTLLDKAVNADDPAKAVDYAQAAASVVGILNSLAYVQEYIEKDQS